jgi:hypothetical protein
MTIAPGSTIGIIGGGQLGRMLGIAAAQLGYRTHIFAPDADPPAGHVAAEVTRGDYTDTAALRRFADAVDVATYEFENLPADSLASLGDKLLPGTASLEIAQDRGVEKRFIEAQGVRVSPWLRRKGPGLGAWGERRNCRLGVDRPRAGRCGSRGRLPRRILDHRCTFPPRRYGPVGCAVERP